MESETEGKPHNEGRRRPDRFPAFILALFLGAMAAGVFSVITRLWRDDFAGWIEIACFGVWMFFFYWWSEHRRRRKRDRIMDRA